MLKTLPALYDEAGGLHNNAAEIVAHLAPILPLINQAVNATHSDVTDKIEKVVHNDVGNFQNEAKNLHQFYLNAEQIAPELKLNPELVSKLYYCISLGIYGRYIWCITV